MNPIYDVVILGCGEAGIFAAYELAVSYTHLDVYKRQELIRDMNNLPSSE